MGFKLCGVVKELSIYLYSGTPGSGKSLHSAQVIQDKLNFGYDVIGTMTINMDCLRKGAKGHYYYQNIYDLKPKELVDFSREYFKGRKFHSRTIEDQLLLVIDESQRIFNARNWSANKDRNDWITFFAEHRHLGYMIILISQNDRMLDRQIRGLIEYEYIHRKVGNFGLVGKLISWVCFSQMFVCVRVWYPMKEKTSSEFFRGKKKLYNFYDSYEQFEIPEHTVKLLPVWLQEEPEPVAEEPEPETLKLEYIAF